MEITMKLGDIVTPFNKAALIVSGAMCLFLSGGCAVTKGGQKEWTPSSDLLKNKGYSNIEYVGTETGYANAKMTGDKFNVTTPDGNKSSVIVLRGGMPGRAIRPGNFPLTK